MHLSCSVASRIGILVDFSFLNGWWQEQSGVQQSLGPKSHETNRDQLALRDVLGQCLQQPKSQNSSSDVRLAFAPAFFLGRRHWVLVKGWSSADLPAEMNCWRSSIQNPWAVEVQGSTFIKGRDEKNHAETSMRVWPYLLSKGVWVNTQAKTLNCVQRSIVHSLHANQEELMLLKCELLRQYVWVSEWLSEWPRDRLQKLANAKREDLILPVLKLLLEQKVKLDL